MIMPMVEIGPMRMAVRHFLVLVKMAVSTRTFVWGFMKMIMVTIRVDMKVNVLNRIMCVKMGMTFFKKKKGRTQKHNKSNPLVN
jgi:hypothetical protein